MRLSITMRGNRRMLRSLVKLACTPHHILGIVAFLLKVEGLLQRNLVLLFDNLRFDLLSS